MMGSGKLYMYSEFSLSSQQEGKFVCVVWWIEIGGGGSTPLHISNLLYPVNAKYPLICIYNVYILPTFIYQ